MRTLPFGPVKSPAATHSYIRHDLLITEENIRIALGASDDPRTQVAAFIVSPIEGNIMASGANIFADWKLSRPERTEAPEKYGWVMHAEARAIANAAKRGIRCEDARIYVTMPPCLNCANLIIASGIDTVYVPKAGWSLISNKWSGECFKAIQAFEETGVKYVEI
jgi:deoxycytidylate deaminase